MTFDDNLLLDEFCAGYPADERAALGVAISGGSDSVALLYLLSKWAEQQDVRLHGVTVDHQIRPESGDEAQFVADHCRCLGIPHSTLVWSDWDKSGNLQDQARRARYSLMAEWGNDHGLNAVALGHTADDQAETFLMRLSRGAGIDGLSGMVAHRDAYGMTWDRPLLGLRRQTLRDYLNRHEIKWVDDPSNDDDRYDRVKTRKILAALEPLGIGCETLTGTAARLLEVRQALDHQTQSAARKIANVQAGDVCLSQDGFTELPLEIKRRLLVGAINFVASAEYGPRGHSVSDVLSGFDLGRDVTLHGCRILAEKSIIRISREYNAVAQTQSSTNALWDRRWIVSGPQNKGFSVAALGEKGLKYCPDWRASGLARVTLLASPAVWNKETLVAAPIAGYANGWSAKLEKGDEHFFKSIISH